MRRAARSLAQARGALDALSASSTEATMAAAVPQMVRHMGGGGGHGPTPETPLSKIMPGIVALPRKIVTTALNLTGQAVVGVATSGAIKNVVTNIADKIVVEESVADLSAMDPAYWTFWLAQTGYTNQAGFAKLATAAKAKLPGMSPCQVTDLTVGFHSVKYFDKDLYNAIAANVSANYMKFDTEQLLKITAAFADNGHYSTQLFDDIADGITYCNHYLAPLKASTAGVAKALAAFAKFSHERADCMLTLARGISELGLSKLGKEERHDAVVGALKAFSTFNFYPEQVDALLFYTQTEPGSFTADELSLAAKVKGAVEQQAGGSLETYPTDAGEDAVHWYGHHVPTPHHYELYVFRDSLVPKQYSPATMRPSSK